MALLVLVLLAALIVVPLVQSMGVAGAALVIVGRWLALCFGAAVAVAIDSAGRLRREYGAEVAAAAGLLVALLAVSHIAGLAGRLLWLASVVVVLAHPDTRRTLLDWLEMRAHRRRWRRACDVAGLRADARWTHARKRRDRVLVAAEVREPWLMRVSETPVGLALRVHAVNWTHEDIARRSVALAAFYGVRAVTVTPDREDISHVTVMVVHGDPLEDPRPLAWPVQHVGRSLWEPVPFGVDEHGVTRAVGIVGRHVLLGGTTGAGKSTALSLLVAACALDPFCRLTLLDGKRVELAAWAPVAERVVGPDIGEAIDVLRAAQDDLDARLDVLLAHGRRKIAPGDPVHVVVVDELAWYSASTGTRKQQAEFVTLLRDLVARGRAAGVVVLAGTQRPSVDLVPATLRDNFGSRVAFRVTTSTTSDVILGTGWAANGADASTIPDGHPGLCFAFAEEERPRRVRAFYLDDDDIAEVVQAAVELRGSTNVGSLLAHEPPPGELPMAGRVLAGHLARRPAPAREAAQAAILAVLRARRGVHAPQGTILTDAGMDATSRTGRRVLDELRQAGVAERTDAGWAMRGGTTEEAPIPAPADDVPPRASGVVIPLPIGESAGGARGGTPAEGGGH